MRLERRVEVRESGCWEWTGHVQTNGYGQMQVEEAKIAVHRLAWMLFRGPIPIDTDVHHRCENRRCVNPDHLELVDHYDHKREHHRKTHCKRGHPFTPENSYVSSTGARRCRNARG
jgi:hypothetical protein